MTPAVRGARHKPQFHGFQDKRRTARSTGVTPRRWKPIERVVKGHRVGTVREWAWGEILSPIIGGLGHAHRG